MKCAKCGKNEAIKFNGRRYFRILDYIWKEGRRYVKQVYFCKECTEKFKAWLEEDGYAQRDIPMIPVRKIGAGMDRLVFRNEDGKRNVELQRVSSVTEDEAKELIKTEEKPAYLQIFFNRELTMDELLLVYSSLIAYHVIRMGEAEMKAAIEEDLTHQPMGKWELKCSFDDAFACAWEALARIQGFTDGSMSVQIATEATEAMKRWLEKKASTKNTPYSEGV